MLYKKYPGIDLAGQVSRVMTQFSLKKYDNFYLPGKKDGKRSGRAEFHGRCVRHLNLESHSWHMSSCKECYSLTLVDQGGLKEL